MTYGKRPTAQPNIGKIRCVIVINYSCLHRQLGENEETFFREVQAASDRQVRFAVSRKTKGSEKET